jgi:glycine reductase
MIGANRVVLGNGIVHVVGDAHVPAEEEKKVRRKLIEKALEALQDEGK